MPKLREHMTPEEREAIKKRAAQLALDMDAVLKTPAGFAILQWIIEQSFLFGEPMTGNSQTFYNLGRMSLGRDICKLITKTDPGYALFGELLLRKEKKDDEGK